MKKVRTGVFETNSSSVHSLVISEFPDYTGEKQLESLIDYDDKIHITTDEFGWGYDGPYHDAVMKLSYLATIIAYKYYLDCCFTRGADYEQTIRENMDIDEEFEWINDFLITHIDGCKGWFIEPLGSSAYPWGVIDHQSYLGSVREFLDYENVSLEEFLLDNNVRLIIDNDNH